jgi:hypothetical protein
MTQAAKKTCEVCGDDIAPEAIIQRKAGLVQGKLLCPNCVELKRRVAMQARAAPTQSSSVSSVSSPPAASASTNDDDELVSLVTDDEMPSSKSQMIRSFATGSTLGGAHHDESLKRPIGGPQDAATRVRTFHCKLTDAGLANLDDIINEWLDSHPEIYIKSVTSSIGTFESKKKEPHLFICLFY